MGNPYRKVDSSEIGFLGDYPTTCAFALTVHGRLRIDLLGNAYAGLMRLHPALNACVQHVDGDVYFCMRDEGDLLPFTTEAVADLSNDTVPLVNPSDSTSRLHVVSAGNYHRITLAVNHAIADGTHLFAVFATLWRQYTGSVSGTTLDAAATMFPSSAQLELDARALVPRKTSGDLSGIRWHGSAPVRTATTPQVVLPDVMSLRFTAQETQEISEAARSVGMTAMLSGVALCAERAGFVDERPDQPIRLGAAALVDMRQHVTPALADTAVTNFVGVSNNTYAVHADADPRVIGAAVVDGIRRDMRTGNCLASLAGAQAESTDAQPEPPITLSNLGVLSVSLPDELVAHDLRPIMSVDSAGLHGDNCGRRPSPLGSIYQMSTFKGQLRIDVITVGGTTSSRARAAVAQGINIYLHNVCHALAVA